MIALMMTACLNDETKNGSDGEDPNGEATYYPFTGEKAEGDASNRAVAVMISNQKQARPQTGLSKADIVFEMLTEGNITRFMALFQSSKPEVVGPVRSAREYFFTLADYYDAMYIFSGAADPVADKLHARDMDYIEGAKYDDDGLLFVREPFRKAPHNLYLQYDGIAEVAKSKDFRTTAEYEPMKFLKEGEDLPEDREYMDGTYAKVELFGDKPIIEFEYDDNTKMYTRTQDGEQMVELESEKPVEMSNVFIVQADHEEIDKEGRRAIDVDGGGSAVLLQQGQAQEVTWENQHGRIVPVKDGEVMPFVPGQTWIVFAQNDSESNGKEQITIGK